MSLGDIPVCLINLPERPERLERSMRELSGFFSASKEINVVKGRRADMPMHGIAQSHLDCIRMAKDKDWDHVCISEDDVRFQSKNSRVHADRVFADLPADADVLLSGIYSGKMTRKQDCAWLHVTDFAGLHFYVVKRSAYDRILEYPGNVHIDRWMAGRRSGGGLKCYVSNPMFAIQYDGFSDNVGRPMKYSAYLSGFNVLC